MNSPEPPRSQSRNAVAPACLSVGRRPPSALTLLPLALLCGVWPGTVIAAPHPKKPPNTAAEQAAQSVELSVNKIRDDVYVIHGAGANVVVQVGPQATIVVDTGDIAHAGQVLSTIRSVTDVPIRYIINTGSTDGFGGNLVLARAGKAFGQSLAGPNAKRGLAPILATGPTAQRLEETFGNDSEAWATHSVSMRVPLYINHQGIEVIAKNAGHTEADAVVLFRASDVLVTGDLFDITRFPLIDTERGGTIQGEIDALNDLIDLAIPNVPLTWLEGGTLIVPSHGRVAQQADLVQYRDMVTIVRDRIKDIKNKGMTLRQVIAADPTIGYTERYGATNAPAFITAIYETLDGAANTKPETSGDTSPQTEKGS